MCNETFNVAPTLEPGTDKAPDKTSRKSLFLQYLPHTLLVVSLIVALVASIILTISKKDAGGAQALDEDLGEVLHLLPGAFKA